MTATETRKMKTPPSHADRLNEAWHACRTAETRLRGAAPIPIEYKGIKGGFDQASKIHTGLLNALIEITDRIEAEMSS